ncbi:MAG TPA: uL15 family ribosomal protein [Candidatus Thermoplasmatota archaeon]|nr:uL15 family ribosomal protein [Candidatus Thermoplasmatota archaeon]
MVGFSKKRRSSKLRGSREHGRGRKKGRGAGLRGGKGNAGAHKHKRVQYFSKMTDGDYWGKHGFKRPVEVQDALVPINVQELDEAIATWAAAGKAQKVGGGYSVNLTELGFDKLLGSGKVRNAIKVTIATASPRATEKIEEAGGQVDVQQ